MQSVILSALTTAATKPKSQKLKATPTRKQGRSTSWKHIWNMSRYFHYDNNGATK